LCFSRLKQENKLKIIQAASPVPDMQYSSSEITGLLIKWQQLKLEEKKAELEVIEYFYLCLTSFKNNKLNFIKLATGF
jgi:hypothetical protein